MDIVAARKVMEFEEEEVEVCVIVEVMGFVGFEVCRDCW